MSVTLAGNEAAALEKLDAALRHASEAATWANRMDIVRAIRQAVEGATELGVHLADGRWAAVAIRLQNAEKVVLKLDLGQIRVVALPMADQFDELHKSVVMLRHGRVRH